MKVIAVARVWTQPVTKNNYFSVSVYIDGNFAFKMPPRRGSYNIISQAIIETLQEKKHLPVMASNIPPWEVAYKNNCDICHEIAIVKNRKHL